MLTQPRPHPPSAPFPIFHWGRGKWGRAGEGALLRVHISDDNSNPDRRLCLYNLRLFRKLYRRSGQVERGGAEVGEGRVGCEIGSNAYSEQEETFTEYIEYDSMEGCFNDSNKK